MSGLSWARRRARAVSRRAGSGRLWTSLLIIEREALGTVANEVRLMVRGDEVERGRGSLLEVVWAFFLEGMVD